MSSSGRRVRRRSHFDKYEWIRDEIIKLVRRERTTATPGTPESRADEIIEALLGSPKIAASPTKGGNVNSLSGETFDSLTLMARDDCRSCSKNSRSDSAEKERGALKRKPCSGGREHSRGLNATDEPPQCLQSYGEIESRAL
jgi:hypothetical protein